LPSPHYIARALSLSACLLWACVFWTVWQVDPMEYRAADATLALMLKYIHIYMSVCVFVPKLNMAFRICWCVVNILHPPTFASQSLGLSLRSRYEKYILAQISALCWYCCVNKYTTVPWCKNKSDPVVFTCSIHWAKVCKSVHSGANTDLRQGPVQCMN
jgi:hypothetical protein